MSESPPDKSRIDEAIKRVIEDNPGKRPSVKEFADASGFKYSDIQRHYPCASYSQVNAADGAAILCAIVRRHARRPVLADSRLVEVYLVCIVSINQHYLVCCQAAVVYLYIIDTSIQVVPSRVCSQ